MKKLSNEEKFRRGTDQPSRMNQPVIQWEKMEEVPDPPDLFNDYGATVWYSVCDQLKRRGELCFVYLPTVEAYCFAAMMFQKAKGELMKDEATLTTTYTNKAGAKNEVPSAWFKILKQSQETMTTFGAKLGLTPLDIQKLPEPKPDDDDDDDDLFVDPTKKRKGLLR